MIELIIIHSLKVPSNNCDGLNEQLYQLEVISANMYNLMNA